jgi:hypothetical protein
MPWDMKPNPQPHEPACGCFECSDERRTKEARARRPKFYGASRATNQARPAMWAQLRDVQGFDINSSWVDLAMAGGAADLEELWSNIVSEIGDCDCLVLYAEADDFPLKGAFVEVGVALGRGKPVRIVAPGVPLAMDDFKPFGSWAKHRLVSFHSDVEVAMRTFSCASA